MIKQSNCHFGLIEYFVRICVIFLSAILLFGIFAEETTAISSFVSETIAFFFLTIIAAYLLLNDKRLISLFVIAFVVKLGIGVWHYITFIDPNYFSSSGETNFMHHEFQAVIQFLRDAASEKTQMGLLHLKMDGYVTHQEFLSIIAIPFHFFGVKMLGIAPINTFFSLFAAMNVFIVLGKSIDDDRRRNFVLFLLAYFPATLLTDCFMRDIVGWGFMSIGLAMMCFSRNLFEKTLSMVLAMPLFYLQRNGYVVIPVLMLLAEFVFLAKRKNLLLMIVSIIATLILIPVAYNLTSNESTDAYVEGVTRWPIYLLPIKIVMGLIGPFPWTNFALFKIVPAVSFYLGDYISGVLNIGILIGVMKGWRKFVNRKSIDISVVMGLLLLMMGIMNEYMHTTYISIGVFFLVPWFIKLIDPKKFQRNVWVAFLLLLMLNIAVVVFGVSGMSSVIR